MTKINLSHARVDVAACMYISQGAGCPLYRVIMMLRVLHLEPEDQDYILFL